MKNRHLLLLIALGLIVLATPASAVAHIIDLATGEPIPFPAMIGDLREAQLVFIGELHDHPGHHQAQLQVIEALHQSGEAIAIGLEMVREHSQSALDSWVAGEMDEETFRLVFEKNWGMYDQYADILRYARQEGIPLVALNIPRSITRQVAREGYESLSPRQLRQVPGVRCEIDEKYRTFIRRSMGGHEHGNGNDSFENFCEAQMVWDTAMAHNAINYLEREPGRMMVVLSGSGHAWKYGIPAQVERQASYATRVLLPEIPGRLEGGTMTEEEADYLLQGLEEGGLH